MLYTLALETAIAGVVAALTSTAGTAALIAGTTALTIYQATRANAAADKQRQIASQRARAEQAGATAKYLQDRSLINRRLAQQIDAARVTAGASGVSGGASQLVLESAYAQQASVDLATISANRARGRAVIDANLANEQARADSMRQNVFAAGLQGVAQGVSMYQGIDELGSRMSAGTPPADGNPDTLGGASQGPYESPIR